MGVSEANTAPSRPLAGETRRSEGSDAERVPVLGTQNSERHPLGCRSIERRGRDLSPKVLTQNTIAHASNRDHPELTRERHPQRVPFH